MSIVIFIALLAMLCCMILFPGFFNDLTLFRIARKARPDADRIVTVAVISLLFFAPHFFGELTKTGHIHPLRSNLNGMALLIVDIFLAVFGAAACIKPIWFMSRLIPRLKNSVDVGTIDRSAASGITLISKLWGIAFLFVAAFLASPLFSN
ncbi:MAG TPA: hypothetical protein VGM02_06955 [Acidobacteriaceae bacterium]|jgi:inner membrane protein involved in colicin E2 resistance